MKIITLRIPKPFSESIDDWPIALQQEVISRIVIVGQANGGLDMCEMIVGDGFDVAAIPSGWRAISSHFYSAAGIEAELPTDESQYTGHIDGAVYKRVHQWAIGHDIID